MDAISRLKKKKKQITKWDFGVGVLGQVLRQAKQYKDKEREEQDGIWDVDLGDIWDLLVCWQTQIFP